MTDRPTRSTFGFGLMLGVALMILSARALAQRGQRPGLLWGGNDTPLKAPVNVDPLLPTGALIDRMARPEEMLDSACSSKQPVCVSSTTAVSVETVRAYLTAMEEARARLVGAMGLPAPPSDVGLGPTPGLDLYLLPAAPEELAVFGDARHWASDRVSAHCRARPLPDGVARQAQLCVGEAIQLGLDAAEPPQLRRAIASYWWSLSGAPTSADYEAVDDLQSNPQLGVVARERQPESPAAALFIRYADRELGAGFPGALPAAMLSLARSETPLGDVSWQNEPDALDVLRVAFAGGPRSFEDFMLDFAVERAFLGARDDGRQEPRLLFLGDAARVRFEWVIRASSLPRRVAPLRPLEPFGATYLWLSLDRVTIDATLAFRAEWEGPASFRWALVGVDAAGKALKRYDLPYVQNATSAERTLVDYADAAALVIVGTNLGGVDLAHPFDPDRAPPEPHGFTVYLTEL
jgi:hypothetical protein